MDAVPPASVTEATGSPDAFSTEADTFQSSLFGDVVHLCCCLQAVDRKRREEVVDELALGLGAMTFTSVLWQQGDANLDSPEASGAPVDPPNASPVVQGHSEEGFLADETVLLPSAFDFP